MEQTILEQWSTQIWLAIASAFIIGCIIGYVVLRTTNGSVKKQQQLANELKTANAKIEQQKGQLEQHFQESATLLSTLAEDYKKLYTHLAKSSQSLLPDETQQKIAFFQQPQLENNVENSTENSAESDDDQPKDYSEGASGILKS